MPDMSVISTWTAFNVSRSLDLSESSVIDGAAMLMMCVWQRCSESAVSCWLEMQFKLPDAPPMIGLRVTNADFRHAVHVG
jgi:hypothetical protein